MAPRIHPTAVISAESLLADDVEIGPYAVLEGAISLGPGCVIRPHAHLIGRLIIGTNNFIGTGCVIGDRPQHLRDFGLDTETIIGDNNTFREHVTVHRGTASTGKTLIGHANYLMANSHIAHDCRVGNRCIIANGALLSGHVELADNVVLSGNTAIHQFVKIGRLAMLSGLSSTTNDLPPFITMAHRNTVVGINVIGMRRAGLTSEDIEAIRDVYRVFFRSGLPRSVARQRIEADWGSIPVVREFLDFVAESKRGLGMVRQSRDAA